MLVGWSVFSEITSSQWTPDISKSRFLLNCLCICSRLLKSPLCILPQQRPWKSCLFMTPTASEPDVIVPRYWKPWDRLQESTALGQTHHPQLERCVPTPHVGMVEGTGILSCCQAWGSFLGEEQAVGVTLKGKGNRRWKGFSLHCTLVCISHSRILSGRLLILFFFHLEKTTSGIRTALAVMGHKSLSRLTETTVGSGI